MSLLSRIVTAIIFIIIILPLYSEAQAYTIVQLAAYEDTLSQALESMYQMEDAMERQEKAVDIQDYFGKILSRPESFNYPFYSLNKTGRIYSPDMKIRAITWNVPYSDGTHRYYGFIQHMQKKRAKKVALYILHDKSSEINNPDKEICTPDKWFGALYYGILKNRHSGQNYYTLIGFDFNDMYSNKKVIDILTIDNKENASFGAPIFDSEDKAIHNRIIFEYSSQAVMTLRYDDELDMIVFDHLSPIEPGLEGVYKFYGPEEYYDGYKFQNGKWTFYPDIDARNK